MSLTEVVSSHLRGPSYWLGGGALGPVGFLSELSWPSSPMEGVGLKPQRKYIIMKLWVTLGQRMKRGAEALHL